MMINLRFLTFVTYFFSPTLCLSQDIQYPLITADKNRSFTSLEYSAPNDLLFTVASPLLSDKVSGGNMYVLNGIDSVVKKIHFPVGGKVCLDNKGSIGAFMGNDQTVRFFNQKTLTLIDSVSVPKLSGYTFIWFTQGGIIIGGIDSNFKYDLKSKKLTEIIELKSYRICDYDLQSDLLLIGYWDETIYLDVKIKTQFLSFSTNPAVKKLLFKTKSGILESFFMGNASRIITQDHHNVYSYDITNNEFKSPIQEGLISVNKSDEEMVVLCVCGNIIYWNSATNKKIKTFTPKYDWIYLSSYLNSPSRKCGYYLNAGLENSIIKITSFKK